MLGSGAIVVMDDTTDMVKACWRIVRFFARESCGKCTPCREGTTWLERILRRIIDGHGRPERPRPAARRLRQHQPGRHVAAAPDHDLRARPLGGVADRLGRARASATSSRPTSSGAGGAGGPAPDEDQVLADV